jgi:uncharacterized protein involved in exopolysaccharide biosynthesis
MTNERYKKSLEETRQMQLTLRDIFAPLFRHRRAVTAMFCTVFALGTLLAWAWAARYYKASFQVLVEQDRSDPPVTTGPNGTVLPKEVTIEQVASEVALLQGDDMLRVAVSTCGLAEEPTSFGKLFLPRDPAQQKAAIIEAATRRLAHKIKVEAQKTSDVIDVAYGRAGEPQVPACVLQTLSKLYVEKHLQLQRPAGTTDFFADETNKYRQALADSESRLTQFSAAQGIAAPDVVRTYMAQQFANTQVALAQARQGMAADQSRIEDIKKQMALTPERSATTETSSASNLLLQNLEATLLAAQLKRTQLLLKYAPDYPLVKEVEEEISETQQALAKAQESRVVRTTDRDTTYEALRADLSRTESDLASAKANAASLQQSIHDMGLQLVKLDSQAVTQASLERDAKANEANYLLYLSKREQERISDGLNKKGIANVTLSVAPVVPALPAYNPWLIMAITLFIAIFAGLAAGFVAEYYDASLRTPSEVIEMLHIPVLASIPRKTA